jgi:uncharacterized protein YqjF (DUF2071 family)
MTPTGFLSDVSRQTRVLEEVAHRPWPVPDGPWAQAQSWIDLAFLHWRIDERELARLVPASVELETYDGSAWLGITPFLLSGLRLRGLPPLPRVSRFEELNVRTYVTRDGKPGIWFFSLEAASRAAVEGAKRLYRLPYHRSRMQHERIGDVVHYESARSGAAFSGRYRGDGPLFQARPGTLEHFLTERYCLYAADGNKAYRAEIHHPPWNLQRGEAHVDLNTMPPVSLPADPPHVLFSARQDVVVWPLAEL